MIHFFGVNDNLICPQRAAELTFFLRTHRRDDLCARSLAQLDGRRAHAPRSAKD